MSVISRKDVEELRAVLRERFDIELDEKITRVEFISPQRTSVYFHANDSWMPPKPPPVQYAVVIHTPGGEVRQMQFKTEKTMDVAFDSFKSKGVYTVLAVVDGVVKKEYRAK
ncbi:MAG: hypothetical protein E7488_05830 [Ruminococcaceae bacterium]|nr:hypothetical protein [Oscillospiraceae bacterium]